MASEREPGLSRLQTMRGMRLWIVSSSLAAVYLSITTGAYATGYALHLGATDALIGFLSAAPALGQILQMVAPLLSERRRRRKPWCMTSYLTGYAVWLPIALIPLFAPGEAAPWTMIVLVLVGGAATALANPASLSWLTDLVPLDVRGRFIGRQQSQVAFVGLVTSLLAGQYLDLFAEGHKGPGFMSLFITAAVFGTASIGAWGFVPEPPPEPSPERVDWHLLRLPLRHANFRNLMIFTALRTSAVYVAAPFFAVYMLEHLDVPYSQVALFSITVTIFTMVSNPLWGYLADKYGYKPILRISSFGVALNPLFWFFANKQNYLWLIPVAQAYGGFVGAGLILSQFNLMLKTAPEEHRSVYLGFHQAVVNVAVALGSLLGGYLAKLFSELGPFELLGQPISHLQVVFLVSGLLRMSGLSYLHRVREAAEVSARTLIREVRSGNPVLTLLHLVRMTRSAAPEDRLKATRGLGSARSTLAVSELIEALEDSDREVRREAARALASIGDERAVWPLMHAVMDPTTDIVEEAVEALGRIASPRSLPALLELLGDERPTVRKSVVLALGNMDEEEAAAALDELLDTEREPSVFLAMTEALSRKGDRRALHRLRRMLRRCGSAVQRRQLANSIGNILGAPGAFYRLLEADAMRQEELVARMLRRSRRQLVRACTAEPARRAVTDSLRLGLSAFESSGYGELVMSLRQAASTVLHAIAGADGPDGHDDRLVGHLLATQPRLRLRFGFLSGLARDARVPLHREEALLAVFALERLTADLARPDDSARPA